MNVSSSVSSTTSTSGSSFLDGACRTVKPVPVTTLRAITAPLGSTSHASRLSGSSIPSAFTPSPRAEIQLAASTRTGGRPGTTTTNSSRSPMRPNRTTAKPAGWSFSGNQDSIDRPSGTPLPDTHPRDAGQPGRALRSLGSGRHRVRGAHLPGGDDLGRDRRDGRGARAVRVAPGLPAPRPHARELRRAIREVALPVPAPRRSTSRSARTRGTSRRASRW